MEQVTLKCICVAAVVAMLPLQANATTSGAQFISVVSDSCSINVTQNGTLDPRSNFRRLTSRSGPGIPGRAIITTTAGSFVASVDAPTAFNTKPAADTEPETFRAWHRSNGATSYSNTQGDETLNIGTNNIRIHMDARKLPGQKFEAGLYQATVVLRCE